MGFIIHFYIIFGTNLLTGDPAQIAVFCLFQCFAKKEYQMDCKQNDTFGSVIFGTNVIQGTWSGCQETNEEATKQGARLPPLGAPSTLVAPSWLHRPTSSSYIYIHIPRKHPGAPRNPISTAATFCTQEIPSWGLFRSSVGGGIDHGGPLHQLHGLSDDV